ncbi:hypothetical protein BT96DRAFT_1009143 [Gymnopus androsaceus JB14]|uniref:Uncharacterized protein n=1 Tax=Gymnopus androsaceus JB14 TaxID=1447944 RepID=A0A6A4GD41_9AGAR|nr:hypothetical protein BT96DRAFT_1009143 [Gymnopus androsaceus JB14]
MHFGDSNPVAGEFHSPVCPICAGIHPVCPTGIHELCPFATLWDDDESRMHSHDGSGIHEENTRPLVGCFNDDEKHSHDGSDDSPQPVYRTCQGLHSDLIHPLQCPFEDSSTLLDDDESRKHGHDFGHDFDNYPHPHKRTQPTNPFL